MFRSEFYDRHKFIGSFINYLFISLWLLLPSEVYAVSFDCKNASNWMEKAICRQSDLGKLDDQLSEAYNAALKKSKNPEIIKTEQRQWLRHLIDDAEGRCTYKDKADSYCIGIFEKRIDELKLGDNREKLGDCREDKITKKHGRFSDLYDDAAIIELQSGLIIYVNSASKVDNTSPIKKKFNKSPPEESSENHDDAVGKYVITTRDFNIGDKVKVCLEDKLACTLNDDRGKTYSIKSYKNPSNVLRGLNSWHLCGGA